MLLEVKGEGQQRHWIRNKPATCCAWGFQPVPCEKLGICTYCRAVSTAAADLALGMNRGMTAAKLLVFSKLHKWTQLPDTSILELILELNRRLEGHTLRK